MVSHSIKRKGCITKKKRTCTKRKALVAPNKVPFFPSDPSRNQHRGQLLLSYPSLPNMKTKKNNSFSRFPSLNFPYSLLPKLTNQPLLFLSMVL